MVRIWTTFVSPGLHKWKDATNYLQHPHRHLFHFRVEVGVTELDREIEFIVLKETVEKFVTEELLFRGYVCILASCEMLAQWIIEYLQGLYGIDRGYIVSVSEDGENGATVTSSN